MASPTIFTPVALDPIQLGTATGTSSGTVYTAGAGGAILDYISVINIGAAAGNVTFYYENNGGTAAGSVVIANAVTIPADGIGYNVLQNVSGNRPFHMEASSKIRASASVGTQFTCHLGGVDYA